MTGRLTRPPFIDPTTGIAYDASNSEFEGYLTKQSMWLRVSNIIAVVLCAHDDDTSAHDDDTRFYLLHLNHISHIYNHLLDV